MGTCLQPEQKGSLHEQQLELAVTKREDNTKKLPAECDAYVGPELDPYLAILLSYSWLGSS